MRIDVYVHATDDPVIALLTKIMAALQQMEQTMSVLSDKVDELGGKITQLTAVIENVETQLDGMAAIIAELRAGTSDQAALDKITALEATVDSVKATLAARAAADNPNP